MDTLARRSELYVQGILRSAATLDDLERDCAIDHTRGKRYPNLVLLKYNQIAGAKMDSPVVQQCRGVILDEADNWRIISRPFDKFFNYGEGFAAPIDWSTAHVQEKLDGSLMQLYWYRGQWHVATSGTPDAYGEVNGHGFTFADLFWRVWREQGCSLPAQGDQGFTFLFELCTPYNKIVVQHGGSFLRLIGVRENESGQESRVSPQNGWARGRMWRPVAEYVLTSLDAVLSTFDTLNPLEQEGYVVVDAQFNRVKVKHPGYVALHHMRDSFSPRAFMEVVLKGEVDEVAVAFPEFAPTLCELDRRLGDLVCLIGGTYALLSGHEMSQREFALQAVQYPWSGILFGLRKGQWATPMVALQDVRVDKVLAWLDLGTDVALDSL